MVPNEEVEMNVTLSAAQVMFSVGNAPTVAEEFNPRAETAELKLSTPLYVGGYDKNITKLPVDLLVRNGFHGCISMVRLYFLFYSYMSKLCKFNIFGSSNFTKNFIFKDKNS